MSRLPGELFRGIAAHLDAAMGQLATLAAVPEGAFDGLLDAVRDPRDLGPEKLAEFAEAAGCEADDLGVALGTVLGSVSVVDVEKGKKEFRKQLERLVAGGTLTREKKDAVLVRAERVWQRLGDTYRHRRLVTRAIARTFPVMSHLHTAVSVAAVMRSAAYDPREATADEYQPAIDSLEPVVLIQVDVDEYGDEKRFGLALDGEQLEQTISRLRAAQKELADIEAQLRRQGGD
jgi:hypothetical protein